ncbi:MAG TPA: nicotinate phosphoribosyltransferase [Tepidisphaeraceae bacterium]|nr:nicotinate phosphoribosyltransferase [Tepidisphaeraceae bacterium]
MLDNLLLMTDSYKVTHWKQYPPGTQTVYSYLEARAGGEYRTVVFFGLQYVLKRYFSGQVVTHGKIEQAGEFFKAHFGADTLFNRGGWEYLLKQHGGRLPVEIRAVPEGTPVAESNVLLTIENTDPKLFWLVNYLETLLVEVWYGCTTATISREMKKIIRAALGRSGTDTPANLAFRLHDFGYRGVSSPESAAIGGAGHLVNFLGTDTLAACELLMQYYRAAMPGFSIPAAEHSTITSWGQGNEEAAYRNMLEQYPTGLVAVVSDSWDVCRAAGELWGTHLRDKVLARDGVLVIRPDSGEPREVLPEILSILAEKFGASKNTKGYRVLNDKVRLIQGDGITRHSLAGILGAVMDAGFSADCLAFGSGGGLLQTCNRDTQRFAMKCSYVVVSGVGQDVYKRPVTDETKNSKRGRLALIRDGDDYRTVPQAEAGGRDVLVPVFRDGAILHEWTLDDIRRAAEVK